MSEQDGKLADSGALQSLRFWQRFHVRLTALYGAAVALLVIAPMATAYYHYAYESEMVSLQTRLKVTATALAAALEGDHIRGFNKPEHARSPYYQTVITHLRAACLADPAIYSIYVLVPTADKNVMKFAVDYESDRAVAAANEPRADPTIGEDYEVARFPKLIEGQEKVTVEDQLVFDDWTLTISGYAPVRDSKGKSVGVLGVDIDGKPIATMRKRVLTLTGGIAVLGMVLFALGGALVGRNIRRPLERLIDATERVARGDLTAEADVGRGDEFGVVGRHFDHMIQGLREREHIRTTFGRYVSEDVARALLANPDSTALGGQVRRVTILFSDLRGYSTISEQLDPTEIVDLLNRYFGAMNGVLDRHNGVVIEFLGDAILAVFNAPQDLEDHAAAAVRCATEMRDKLEELNAAWSAEGIATRWQQVGLEKLGQRIGIHTGDVVAGNLGSVERTKYAVIGDTVNLAARLEQLNKDVDSEGILLSGETFEALPEALQADCSFQERRTVKGRETEVAIYSV